MTSNLDIDHENAVRENRRKKHLQRMEDYMAGEHEDLRALYAGPPDDLMDLPGFQLAAKIMEILPVEGTANVWGDEIYFDIPLNLDLEGDARADVEVGDLAYWPTGSAFCIFFGPTPVSTDEKPRAYSPVNVFGKVIGDALQFKAVPDGSKITVTF